MRKRTIRAALATLLACTASSAAAQGLAGKKVLFVNSYHADYEWSAGVEAGARSVLAGTGVKLDFHRMDTKRHGDEAFKKKAGVEAKRLIETTKPDVVILADDNAVSYVYAQYFKDSAIPFVFCGVNWDSSKYGPFKNATGMEEVALTRELVENLRAYAKGSRIGYLSADNETERIDLPFLKKQAGTPFQVEKYVKTLAEWNAALAKMQGEVDLVIIGNNAGIADWDANQATSFAAANARIPTGTVYDWMMPYAMVGLVKIAEEQGIWSAKAALEILRGKKPTAIPIAQNKQGRTMLNVKLATQAGITFRPALLKNAQVLK
jgi:ABC-type uncharacterized transport system substrate-binding protein